ncbi:MAG: hypothetical protein KFB95_09950 [Simkaniaceae bacterium]|nr:MAG: hypothetical protein KFB95_09950 [Simkaniaceae bacterium]
MENERKNILRSSMLMLAAAFAGAIVANSVKGLSFLFSTVIIYFFTRLFSAVGILRTLFQKGKLSVQKEHFLMIVLTVIFYNLSMYFYFFSLKKISIVDASLLFNSAPLFVPFFAVSVQWGGVTK